MTWFVSAFPEVELTLAWSPVKHERVTDTTVQKEALKACACTPVAGLNMVQSGAYQKQAARQWAFTTWAKEVSKEVTALRCHVPLYHTYAFTHPPDGCHHPLWKAATVRSKYSTSPPFSQHTTITMFCLAAGHAFISDYSRRFRPDLPPESLTHMPMWLQRPLVPPSGVQLHPLPKS